MPLSAMRWFSRNPAQRAPPNWPVLSSADIAAIVVGAKVCAEER
jgi:hypothetical protein